MSQIIINCDDPPFMPDGWMVADHKQGGLIELDPRNFSLYVSRCQDSGSVEGEILFNYDLKHKPVCNACILDGFLAHPECIPPEWEPLEVNFWGTGYFTSNHRYHFLSEREARYLYRDPKTGLWSWSWHWLFRGYNVKMPALLHNPV